MEKKRIEWLDLIKILACFFIVILHTITLGLNGDLYKKGLWIYYIGVMGIPLFFMVSGYLQLYKESNYKYVLKKIKNILFITLFWNIIFFLMKKIKGTEDKSFLYEVVGCFIQRGNLSQFWFWGTLIIIYLLLPVFQKLYKNNKYNIFVIILFLYVYIVDILSIIIFKKFNISFKTKIIQTFRLWTWFFYFFLGGFFRKNEEKIKNKFSKTQSLIYFIILFIVMICYEYLLGNRLYGTLYCEYYYDSPLIIITTFMLFTLLSMYNFNNNKWINYVSSLTPGIYIIHRYVISFVTKIFTFDNNYYRIILTIIVFILSAIIIAAIDKIPKLNKVIKF